MKKVLTFDKVFGTMWMAFCLVVFFHAIYKAF